MKIADSIITALSSLKSPDKKTTIQYAKHLKNRCGIEVGGPSDFFKRKSYFPIYLFARQIDGVNFGTHTVWEGAINEGNNYQYYKSKNAGYQYITEAVELNGVPEDKYDFLLSCHSLEHIANPIKALKRWYEVLKPGGSLILILPNKDVTFDVNRPITQMHHLIDDYKNNVDEHDDTHFKEVLQLHKLEADDGIADMDALKERTLKNFQNRCVHHHIFSLNLIKEVLEYCNFEIKIQKTIHRLHLFTIATKPI